MVAVRETCLQALLPVWQQRWPMVWALLLSDAASTRTLAWVFTVFRLPTLFPFAFTGFAGYGTGTGMAMHAGFTQSPRAEVLEGTIGGNFWREHARADGLFFNCLKTTNCF